MKILRTTLAIGIVILLVAGYAVSQVATLKNWAPQYSERVDSSTVSHLALVLLIAIVALGFIKDPGTDDS